jgi:hypothetical protein
MSKRSQAQGATEVQMTHMRSVLALATQSGNGASAMGGGGSKGRAAKRDHGDIQQGGTMGGGRVTSMSARAP